jgi:hypothetical protein
MIAPAEYKFAIIQIVNEAIAISREELVVETAELFGFDRTGADLKNEIDRQTAELIEEAKIVGDGDVVRRIA